MHWKRLATFVLPASWLTTASAALYALVLLLTDWRPAATLAPGVPGWAMTWLAATVLINLAYFLLASGFVARIGGRIVAGVRGIGVKAAIVIVMFIAGAFAGEALGLMPPASEWPTLSVPVLRAAAIYLACFISPVAVYLAVKLLLHLRREQIAVKRSEFGALCARFGRPIAGLLLVAPLLMGAAQIVSFLTSYLGLTTLWGAVADERWLDLRIPVGAGLAELLALNDGVIDIELSRLTVLAFLGSAVLSATIWFAGCLAVARVREVKPVPRGLFALIFALGLISTYSAFLMWSGQVASREELRDGLRETEAYAAAVNQSDLRLLKPLTDLVASEADNIAGQLASERRSALSTELADLRQALRATQESYREIADRLPPLADLTSLYQANYRCEVATGCLTQLAGRGAVARNLLILAAGFGAAAVSWAEMLDRHIAIFDAAMRSGQQVELALADDQFDAARRELDAMHGHLRELRAATPMPVLSALRLQASRPVTEGFGGHAKLLPQQQDALSKLDGDLAAVYSTVQRLIDDAAIARTELPARVDVNAIGRDSVVELFQLRKLGGYVDHLLQGRRASIDRVLGDIGSLTAEVDALPSGPELINARDVIAQQLNTVRLRLQDTVEPIDLGPLRDRAGKLERSRPRIETLLAAMEVTERTALPEFRLIPLHLSVLRYAHLSVVSGLIQCTLDFLATLGIAFAIYVVGISGAGENRGSSRVAKPRLSGDEKRSTVVDLAAR